MYPWRCVYHHRAMIKDGPTHVRPLGDLQHANLEMESRHYWERQRTPMSVDTEESSPSTTITSISPNSQRSRLIKVEVKTPPKPKPILRPRSYTQEYEASVETHTLINRNIRALRDWVIVTTQNQERKERPPTPEDGTSAASSDTSSVDYVPQVQSLTSRDFLPSS